MEQLPQKLEKQLNGRKAVNALRKLGKKDSLIDFSSNDYLGFAKSQTIFEKTHKYLVSNNIVENGATGSRLLTGNHSLYTEVERMLCSFYNADGVLIFNSGYDANVGFFSSVPQRGDIILYDELIHASIRDGITMSNAKSYKFKHNDLEHLEMLLKKNAYKNSQIEPVEVYVVTESVFSMDGDSPDLNQLTKLCQHKNVHLVVDEAHAVGIFNGGLVAELNLQSEVFARIITFGKAIGCHGSAIIGSEKLLQYLINFARSFIYTTGLPPHSLATVKMAYEELESFPENSKKLQENIKHFKSEANRLKLNFIKSNSTIHCIVVSGNYKTKGIADKLQQKGFDVKAILAPTVPVGKERLRFCLHSYNSKQEITTVLENLTTFAAYYIR